MNSLLFKSKSFRASPSLLALSEWQEKEKQALNCAVDEEGCLLDNLTLELRVHPPEVHIDNAGDPQSTLITIDSANRPGSLVFVSILPNIPCLLEFFRCRKLTKICSFYFRLFNILQSSACASIALEFLVMEAGFMTVSRPSKGFCIMIYFLVSQANPIVNTF